MAIVLDVQYISIHNGYPGFIILTQPQIGLLNASSQALLILSHTAVVTTYWCVIQAITPPPPLAAARWLLSVLSPQGQGHIPLAVQGQIPWSAGRPQPEPCTRARLVTARRGTVSLVTGRSLETFLETVECLSCPSSGDIHHQTPYPPPPSSFPQVSTLNGRYCSRRCRSYLSVYHC